MASQLVLLGRNQANGRKQTLDTEKGEPQPVAASSSESELSSDVDGATSDKVSRQWRYIAVAFIGLLTLGLCFVWVASAYYRGQAAAAAALEAFGSEDFELEQLDLANDQIVAMQDRAGRGNVAQDWHEYEETYDPTLTETLDVPPSGPAPRGGRRSAAPAFWGDTWLQLEMNRFLEWKRDQMNNNTAEMVAAMGQPQMSDAPNVKIDAFTGIDSIKFDKFEATRVVTDLDTSTAQAYLQMKAHTTLPLRAKGKASAKKNGQGAWYHFTIQVNNFWIHARKIKAEASLGLPPSVSKASVGWVDSGFGQLDCVCYNKKQPWKKDGLCTKYMQGAMEKARPSMIYKISKKLTTSLQEKLDTELVGKKSFRL